MLYVVPLLAHGTYGIVSSVTLLSLHCYLTPKHQLSPI